MTTPEHGNSEEFDEDATRRLTHPFGEFGLEFDTEEIARLREDAPAIREGLNLRINLLTFSDVLPSEGKDRPSEATSYKSTEDSVPSAPENSFENPFDQTIWDPIDSEQAIEDPLHGPEAVAGLLSIPPFKNPDGTYYVFGGSYAFGTTDFDAEGRPFLKIGRGQSMLNTMHQLNPHSEWIKKWHAGELPAIEDMDYPDFQFGEQPYFIFDS